MIWDSATLDRLRELAASGMTAAQMAEAIGGDATRNAVIGACHRNGIPFGPKRGEKPERPPVQPKPRAPKAAPAPRRARGAGVDGGLAFRMHVAAEWARNAPPLRSHEDDVGIPVEQRKTLTDLGAAECRYPFGDGPFLFCGAPTPERSAYCRAHHNICFAARAQEGAAA